MRDSASSGGLARVSACPSASGPCGPLVKWVLGNMCVVSLNVVDLKKLVCSGIHWYECRTQKKSDHGLLIQWAKWSIAQGRQ